MSDQSLKRCSICGEMKALEAFHVLKRVKDGRRAQCKACRVPQEKVRHDNLAQRQNIQTPTEKRCPNCGEFKTADMFAVSRQSKDGLKSHCKACVNAYDRAHRQSKSARDAEWRRANHQRVLERSRAWYRRNKEKLRIQRQDPAKKERRRQRVRAWYWHNLDRLRAKNLLWARSHPDRMSVHRHRRRARIANISGFFTEQDIQHITVIQQGHCAYCGRLGQRLSVEHIIPITRPGTSNDPWNICLACRTCNSSKNDRTLEEWIKAGRWFDNLKGGEQ